jgi:hypothetical protein
MEVGCGWCNGAWKACNGNGWCSRFRERRASFIMVWLGSGRRDIVLMVDGLHGNYIDTVKDYLL